MANVQDRGPPSAAAVAIGTAIMSGLAGYYIGQARSIGLFGNNPSGRRSAGAKISSGDPAPPVDDPDYSSESDDVDGGEDLGELSTFADSNEECKLVLVVRTDLGMGKGKIAAQCSHATLACYKALVRYQSPILKLWERRGQAKVALKIDSEDEMLVLQAQAIASGSATVLGIGPAPKSKIDEVTGHLKLL